MSDPIQEINLKGAIDLGARTIQSLILVNGGAAVGLLTLLGREMATGSRLHSVAGQLTGGLVLFALGVFAAVVCLILAYLSQLAAGASTGPKWIEKRCRYVAIMVGVTSALFFLSGVAITAFALARAA